MYYYIVVNTLTWIAQSRTGCRHSVARQETRTPRPRRPAPVSPSPVSRRFARHVLPADGPTAVACTARAGPPPRPFPFSPSSPRLSARGTSPSPNPNRAKTDGPAWKVRYHFVARPICILIIINSTIYRATGEYIATRMQIGSQAASFFSPPNSHFFHRIPRVC